VTYTNAPLIPCQKLTGSTNYSTWTAAVQLWFHGQGREEYLTKQLKDVLTKDQDRWKQTDASLCSVLWFSIDDRLQQQFQAFTTCYEVWAKAKTLYSNDVHHLYSVVSNFVSIKLEDNDVQTYLGKFHRLIADYGALMPFTDNVETHAEQRSKFFMALALAGLPPSFESVRSQILSGTVVPSFETVCEQLFRLSAPQMFSHPLVSSSPDSSALVSHSSTRDGRNGGRYGSRGNRPRCNYCHRYGHIEAECRTKT